MSDFEELGFKVGHSFIVYKRSFKPWSKTMVLRGLKPLFRIGVGNGRFWPNQRGSALKPSSSKVGTSLGHNYFTVVHQMLFWTGVLERMWTPHWIPNLYLSSNDGFHPFHKKYLTPRSYSVGLAPRGEDVHMKTKMLECPFNSMLLLKGFIVQLHNA